MGRAVCGDSELTSHHISLQSMNAAQREILCRELEQVVSRFQGHPLLFGGAST